MEEGDEIIVSGLDLRYFKSGKKTSIRTKPTGWQNSVHGYKSVKFYFEEVRSESEPRDLHGFELQRMLVSKTKIKIMEIEINDLKLEMKF
jgi:hypothetical protein